MRRGAGKLSVAAVVIGLLGSSFAGVAPVSAQDPTPTPPAEASTPGPFEPPTKSAGGDRPVGKVGPAGQGGPTSDAVHTVDLASPASLISPLASCTPRIGLLVSNSARFNLGADPDASTCGAGYSGWDLMFRWPGSPGTSFATIQVDGSDWIYGTDGYPSTYPVTDGLANESAWWTNEILVTQRLEIVPNDVTGTRDVLRISYTLTNYGAAAHTVGLRSMIDTELMSNDGAIFRASGLGTIYNEREFWHTEVPTKLETLYSSSDTVHVGTVTLRSPGSPAPDHVVIAQWPRISQTTWDYLVDSSRSITSDSALGTYWDPTRLGAGASRTYTLAYGRGTASAATLPVSPADGPWYGRNEVMISVPGLGATTEPYVTVGSRVAAVVGHGAGWVRVTVPSRGAPPYEAKVAQVVVRATDAGGRVLFDRSDAYTYRGVAVIFLRGIGSHLDGDDFADNDAFGPLDLNGVYVQLTNQGIPASALYQFSYKSGSPTYGCVDTYADPAVDASTLHRQVNQLLVLHKNLDVYLVGHSKGGVVAMTYLAMLLSSRMDPAHLRAALASGTGQGRLAGIVTLDSPVGGIRSTGINQLAYLRCLQVPSEAERAFMGQMNRLRESAADQNPLGSHASIGALEYPGALGASNQVMAERASARGTMPGPDILTVGNVYDDVFNLTTRDTWLPYTTQWLKSSSGSSRTWARSIATKTSGWFGSGHYLRGANHGLVTDDPYVAGAVAGMIKGLVPPTATGFSEPPVNRPAGQRPLEPATAVTGAGLDATAPAVVSIGIGGTILAAGGLPLANADIAVISTDTDKVRVGKTAANGTYAIGAPAGSYLVAIHDTSGTHPFGYAGPSGFTTQVAEATQATVGAGVVTVNVELPAGHHLSGSARVGGDALAGVVVEAVDGDGHVVAGAITGANASYTLVVPDGSYVVRARGDGGVSATAYHGAGGAVPDAASAAIVTVSGVGVDGVDLDLPSIGHLNGTVTDTLATPLAGISVTATARDGSGIFSTATSPDGSFSLPVDPGTYAVAFSDPTATYADGYLGPTGWVADPAAALAVPVAFNEVGGIAVVLPAPGTPGAPTGVTAVHGSGNGAWLDWEPPASNGGAAITSYAVVAEPGDLLCTAYAVPGCEVDGLTPGEAYTFVVYARNAAGWGSPSAVSGPFTAIGVPGIPGWPTAIAGDASAMVSWSAPTDDGGSPVTSYTVTSAPDGRTCTAVAPTHSCRISGLSYWQTYTFTVTATNAYGEGQPTPASDGVRPLDLTAPTAVAPATSVDPWMTISGSTIPLAVTLKGSDGGGSGVSYFQVQRSNDGGKTWGPSRIVGCCYYVTVKSSGTVRFRARAFDHVGRVSPWKVGPILSPRQVQENASAVRWTGTWKRASSKAYLGGTIRYSKAKGASTKLIFTGRSVALVSSLGPTHGQARIFVGSTLVGTVDLYASTSRNRVIVWQRTWATRATRTVRVVVVGTTGRPRVDVDAFVVLK